MYSAGRQIYYVNSFKNDPAVSNERNIIAMSFSPQYFLRVLNIPEKHLFISAFFCLYNAAANAAGASLGFHLDCTFSWAHSIYADPEAYISPAKN